MIAENKWMRLENGFNGEKWGLGPGLPDFSRYNIGTKMGKNVPNIHEI
jgi:hypothetical protein